MTVRFISTARGEPQFDAEASAARRSFSVDPGLRPAFVAADAGAANLERLLTGDTLCVTTGQQPGLLTGPLYTLYKALSAIALARSLETRLERAVVPVFWVAGDDHDFAEANHIHLPSGDHVRRAGLRKRSAESSLVPLYREPVGKEIDEVLAALAEETPASEFRPAVMEWVTRHYRPEADLATAFAESLAELLGRVGLVVFRPSHSAAKARTAPWLMRALEGARDLEASVAQRIRSLEAAGRSAPVSAGDGATLVMIEGRLGRDRLLATDSGFTARRSGEQWTLAELRQIAVDEPERLSANVLLRPVVEAAILPTVAYIAGPAELAYLRECDPIYTALAVEPQERVGRWSGLVVERHVDKVLEKFGLAPADFDSAEGELEARLARDDMPSEVAGAIRSLRESLQAEYARLADASKSVDPTLERNIQSVGHGALKDLEHVEKRIITHLKKQNAVTTRQIRKVRANLFPLGKPQERIFNVTPFLARYGWGFIDDALATCAVWSAPLETAPSKA